jgi:serine/threonine protein kinase
MAFPQPSVASPSPNTAKGSAPQATPAVVGPYRLLRALGRGGTGVVCEAEDTSRGRRVALKLIPHEPFSGAGLGRLLGGARLAGRVRHPHVVSLYDTGTYSGGVYLVLELVEGRSVQSLLGDGPLPWREATAILAAACAGLGAVHAAGIIHCDLKPANLLRAAAGTVKLTDFGLARRLGRSRRSVRWEQAAGTAHYMSPEQCRAEEPDERADLYALGATYHTLLTGGPPYAGVTPLQILFAQCSAPVPDPRDENPEIPGACAEIVRRAMAKKRADRYASAGELQKALRAVLRGEGLKVTASPCRRNGRGRACGESSGGPRGGGAEATARGAGPHLDALAVDHRPGEVRLAVRARDPRLPAGPAAPVRRRR